MCDICHEADAKFSVLIKSAPSNYLYKNTLRCEPCKDRAVRGHGDDVEVKKL